MEFELTSLHISIRVCYHSLNRLPNHKVKNDLKDMFNDLDRNIESFQEGNWAIELNELDTFIRKELNKIIDYILHAEYFILDYMWDGSIEEVCFNILYIFIIDNMKLINTEFETKDLEKRRNEIT
jgi:hypothetical protein